MARSPLQAFLAGRPPGGADLMFATLSLRSPLANIAKVPAEKEWRCWSRTTSSLARPFLGALWRLVLRPSADFLAGVLGPRSIGRLLIAVAGRTGRLFFRRFLGIGLLRRCDDAHFGIGNVAFGRNIPLCGFAPVRPPNTWMVPVMPSVESNRPRLLPVLGRK